MSDQESPKILGFVFGRRSNVTLTIWSPLRKFPTPPLESTSLQKSWNSKPDLHKLYKVFLVPLLDSTAVVNDSMFVKYQIEGLEGLQRCSIRTISSYDCVVEEKMAEFGLTSLAVRRRGLVVSFDKKKYFPPSIWSHLVPQKSYSWLLNTTFFMKYIAALHVFIIVP